MGHHPFGEPDLLTYQLKIAEKLGFEASTIHVGVDWGGHCQPLTQAFVDSGYGYFTEEEKDRLRARLDGGQAICVLKINDVVVGFLGWQQFLIPDNGKTLNLFELSWDRATERLQKTLLELDEDYKETVELDNNLEPVEGGRDRESDRAGINSLLKRFVNQNLGDPAIYLGAYGDAIRRVVAEGLSTIAASAGPNGEHEYSIVSDSLGSRVVFDTLGCAVDSGHGKPARGCEYLRDEKRLVAETKAALSAVASQTTKVFMNANQLPFLALSNVRPPARNETEVTWLNRFPCEGGGPGLVRALVIKKALETPVQIVAFTDPNDALSYHLTERFRKNCCPISLPRQRLL
jgi:hypothetical protein